MHSRNELSSTDCFLTALVIIIFLTYEYFQTMGGGVPRVSQWRRHGEVAAGIGRPGARQHHLHPGLARVRVPHHRLQLAGRQDPRRQTIATWYVELLFFCDKCRYTVTKPPQLLKARIHSGDHQKSADAIKLDEVPGNEFN